ASREDCFQCHGLKAQKGGLRVDTMKALLAGGDTGPAIVPGKSGESLLIAAVSGAEGVTRMPLKKPALPAEQIATLKAWIDAGATAPANDPADEVAAFVADTRPDAYDRVVDRLLASPHYGERWGRHWLDLARYADSNGYSIDAPREIWKYRDYVIEALNCDLPFDQFTIEQIAGD